MNREEIEIEVEKIHSLLYKIALSKLNNVYDADDAVNETLYLATKHIKKLKDKSKFKYWVLAILKRECNRFYKNKDDDQKLLDKVMNATTEDIDYSSAEMIEDSKSFDEMVECLDEDEKKIFEMRIIDKETFRKISNKLDLNPNTVRSKFRRGKEKIKELHKKKFERFALIILVSILFTSGIAIASSIIVNKIKEVKNYEVLFNSEKVEKVEYDIENNELTLKIDFCEDKINKNNYEPYLNDKTIYLINMSDDKNVIYPLETAWLQEDVFKVKFDLTGVNLGKQASIHAVMYKGESITILLKK